MVARVQPQVVSNPGDGTLKMKDIEASLFPTSIWFAPVRLIAVENTIDGKALTLDYLNSVSELAQEHALKIHMDGARIFNAAVSLRHPVSKIAGYCDTVSFCLSKGLGVPIGSILLRTAEVIEKARIHRLRLGGGMWQAGVIAAAGLYAMRNNVSRLKSDRTEATELATALSRGPGTSVKRPTTSMVFCDVDASARRKHPEYLKENGIHISGTPNRQRWVTHLGIDEAALASTWNLLTQMQETNNAR